MGGRPAANIQPHAKSMQVRHEGSGNRPWNTTILHVPNDEASKVSTAGAWLLYKGDAP